MAIANAFIDLCEFNAASAGTGAFVEGTPIIGYRGSILSGASNGKTYSYRAFSPDQTQWEYGVATYSSTGPTWTRTTVIANSSGGATPFNFTVPPIVGITSLAQDIQNPVNLINGIGPAGNALISNGTTPQWTAFEQAFTNSRPRAWQAKVQETISPSDFTGWNGDGINPDDAAWNSAIAYANLVGNIAIEMPNGLSYISAPLTIVIANGVMIVGKGLNASQIKCNIAGGGRVFQFGSAANPINGGGMDGIWFSYAAVPAINSAIIVFGQAARMAITNIYLDNVAIFAIFGINSSSYAAQILFDAIIGITANLGVPLFDVIAGTGLKITNVDVINSVPGGGLIAASGRYFLSISGGVGYDTLLGSDLLIQRFDAAFIFNSTAGIVTQNIFLNNVVADGITSNGIFCGATGAGAYVTGLRVTNSWFTVQNGRGIWITQSGGGININHSFTDCIIWNCGDECVRLDNGTIGPIIFDGCTIASGNMLGNGANCVEIIGGAKGFSFVGCRINEDLSQLNGVVQGPIGINLGADCDNYLITSCYLDGSTLGIQLAANTSGSQRRLVANNTGPISVGIVAITVPASGVNYSHTSAQPGTLLTIGGTVTNMTARSTALGAAVPALPLLPGTNTNWTYTVAPTVLFVPDK